MTDITKKHLLTITLLFASSVNALPSPEVEHLMERDGPGPGGRPYCCAHGWTNIGPGSPGVWAPIAVDPMGSGTIYAASVGGGVRKSTDDGATWTAVNSGSIPRAIYSFAMDASGPDTVYAGAFSPLATAPSGVYKSGDGGSTWTFLSGTATIAVTLTADPNQPGVVFLGGLNGQIRRTLDGGSTWSLVHGGILSVYSIVIDPTNSNLVYASTTNGALKSTDGGTNWSAMEGLTSMLVWGLAIDSADTNVLYAATNENGVWRSLDAGISWHALSTLPQVPFSLMVDPTPAHRIYAATSRGMWHSSDGGVTWQPTSLSNQMTFSISKGPNGALYAGTASGVALSLDRGATWTDPDPGLGGSNAFGYAITVDPKVGKKLFVTTLGSTVRMSTDQGANWSAFDEGYSGHEARKINLDPTDSNRMYMASLYGGGLFKSIDGGATWSRRTLGSAAVYTWVPVVDPVSPNIVYVGTVGEGLFKSTDYGDSWTTVPGLPLTVQGVTVDPRDDRVVFAATSSGIFRSKDAGQTWSNVLNGAAWSITIVGGDSHVVYATLKQAGVFRSLNDGDTWQAINVGITNRVMGRAAPVIVASGGGEVLFVGSEGGAGVYRSTDGGNSWFTVNLGLYDTSVFGLAQDPVAPYTLYASGPHGIFATISGGL
jgi:photosystem II stability/assembly factor-like uncharacterized protein